MNVFKIMPAELWLETINFIPLKDLFPFRLACTTFKSLSAPKFLAITHFHLPIFEKAVESESIDTLQRLHKNLQADEIKSLLFHKYFMNSGATRCFGSRFQYPGSISILRVLYSWTSLAEKALLIKENEYCAFRESSRLGRMDVVTQIYQWCSDEEKGLMIKSWGYYGYRLSRCNGHMDVSRQIYEWA